MAVTVSHGGNVRAQYRTRAIPAYVVQVYVEQTGWCNATPHPFSTHHTGWHSLILSRPVGAKQLAGPSLPKLMAQSNTHVDSGIIRISFILGRPVAVKQLPGPSLPKTDGTF